MQLTAVKIPKPETLNIILGQAHFSKTVADLHAALWQMAEGAQKPRVTDGE